MRNSGALVAVPPGAAVASVAEMKKILKGSICPKATDEELDYFLAVCRSIDANPILREAHLLITEKKDRNTGNAYGRSCVVHVGIDWLRRKAMETSRVFAIYGPHVCGADSVFVENLPEGEAVRAARVGILLDGMQAPIWCIARWSEFGAWSQKWSDNNYPLNNWAKMPVHMLCKVAISQALKWGVACMSGVYTTEELEANQAFDDEITAEFTEEKTDRLIPRPDMSGALVARGDLEQKSESRSSTAELGSQNEGSFSKAEPEPKAETEAEPEPEPEEDEDEEEAEKKRLIALIKTHGAVAFPSDNERHGMVDWAAMKDIFKPMAWCGPWSRVFPQFEKWGINSVITLEHELSKCAAKMGTVESWEEEEAEAPEVPDEPEPEAESFSASDFSTDDPTK